MVTLTKDYRSLLSDIANLLDDILDLETSTFERMGFSYTRNEVSKMEKNLIEMFGEIDDQGE